MTIFTLIACFLIGFFAGISFGIILVENRQN